MKKILAILGAVSLTASVSTTLVACNNNKSDPAVQAAVDKLNSAALDLMYVNESESVQFINTKTNKKYSMIEATNYAVNAANTSSSNAIEGISILGNKNSQEDSPYFSLDKNDIFSKNDFETKDDFAEIRDQVGKTIHDPTTNLNYIFKTIQYTSSSFTIKDKTEQNVTFYWAGYYIYAEIVKSKKA
ncbi:hypothetical protein SSYRP_v1c08910 [Spiroplasma syrphidicola EA-1]|uniref:Lipoprotein n=1 Tax=Spiroplasma syrphidicola EA-1 TaxID=1276229 RepID=R4UJZ3_9MOLU|nr:lipoprotein [Spiroplasma syrphidicola]AGM26480.1 hypothetical protein SSYRP_v1c08910 [Spiroplasma syrphidicola EA-1]